MYYSDDYAGFTLGDKAYYFGYEETHVIKGETDEDWAEEEGCFTVSQNNGDETEELLFKITQSDIRKTMELTYPDPMHYCVAGATIYHDKNLRKKVKNLAND